MTSSKAVISSAETVLRWRVEAICEHFGGVRAAGRALKINYAYLSRLKNGEKSNPTPRVLRKLGLQKVVTYAPIRTVLDFKGELLEMRP